MRQTHNVSFVDLRWLDRMSVSADVDGDLVFDFHIEGEHFCLFLTPGEATQIWRTVFDMSTDVRLDRYGDRSVDDSNG